MRTVVIGMAIILSASLLTLCVIGGVFEPAPLPDHAYRCPICLATPDDFGIVDDTRCPMLNTLQAYRCPRGHTWVMLPEEP